MKKIIIGNWKCNPSSLEEAKAFFSSFQKNVKTKEGTEVALCPPFIYISELRKIAGQKIKIGAQNCFWEDGGAFTGEISPKMLKNLGCNYIILGHSERREIFKENDDVILAKIKSVLKVGLTPILCIGEKKEERGAGDTFNILRSQIKKTLGELSNSRVTNMIIAYEPIWAIGTGDNCPPNEAMTVLMFIKKELMRLFSKRVSEKIPILYGGSVNSKNAFCYIEAGFNGLLVGGASLKPG